MSERPVLIGLCGYAQVGKDTAAEYLQAEFGYERTAFADALRVLTEKVNPIVGHFSNDLGAVHYFYLDALRVLGYEEAKATIPEVRGFLKRLGTGAREVLGKDVWVNAALRNVKPYSTVSDVRFVNEAECIRQKAHFMGGQALIVRVARPLHGPESDFEREVADIRADYVVSNYGTFDDLHSQLRWMMENVGGWKQEPFDLWAG